jgi:hypothetical protein
MENLHGITNVLLTMDLPHVGAGSLELTTNALASIMSSTSLLEPDASSCPSFKLTLGLEHWKQTVKQP